MKIFITWISSGIGKNLSKRYIDLWNKVYWVVRSTEQKEKLLKDFPTCEIYVCDLSDIKQVEKLSKQIQKENFDLMILNAWYWEYKVFSDQNSSDIHNQILVNLYSPILLVSNYIENVISNNTKIVFISSITWSMPIKKLSVYGATKWWLSQFYRVFKKENPWLQSLCLELWATKTPMHKKSWMKKTSWRDIDIVCEKIIKMIKIKKWMQYLYLDWWLVAKIWNIIK